jgi:hypothetical protein
VCVCVNETSFDATDHVECMKLNSCSFPLYFFDIYMNGNTSCGGRRLAKELHAGLNAKNTL